MSNKEKYDALIYLNEEIIRCLNLTRRVNNGKPYGDWLRQPIDRSKLTSEQMSLLQSNPKYINFEDKIRRNSWVNKPDLDMVLNWELTDLGKRFIEHYCMQNGLEIPIFSLDHQFRTFYPCESRTT
jgi:hypothetical protein